MYTRTFGACFASAVVLLLANTAEAQVNSDFTFNIDGSEPKISVAFQNNGSGCSLFVANQSHSVRTRVITVTTGGTYSILDLTANSGRDTGVALYSGNFNPSSPSTNCLKTADGNASWPLSPGTYTLVGGPFIFDNTGAFTMRLAGPAAVTALPLPAISALSPATGVNTGGAVVTITGTNFTGATAVTLGSLAATSFVVDSDTQIRAVVPASAIVGSVNVRVTTAAGMSEDAGTADDFTYAAPIPVPTLSEWAMGLMGLLLTGATGLFLQRRRAAG